MTKERQKKNNLINVAALCLAALAVFCLLCTCVPPIEGDEGDASVTITIGGGSRGILDNIDPAQLDHTITMTNGSGANVEKTGVKTGQTVQFVVTSGHWNISVKAYLSGRLVAEGSVSVDLKPGRNGSVPITMRQVGVTSTITTYEIIMLTNNDDYGTATAEPNPAPEGETVYIHANSYYGYRFDTWEVISGDVTLSEPQKSHTEFTMPSNSVTIMANFKEVPPDTPNLEIQDDAIFDDVIFGYAQPEAMTVTIHNSGTYTATVSNIELSGENATLFILGGNLAPTIAAHENATFIIQPQGGLGEGTYTATITVTYSGGEVESAETEAEVSFRVHPAPITIYEITLTVPVEGETPAQAITPTTQYSGKVTWNTSDSFFKGGTEYTATIHIEPVANHTLTGVGTDFFTVTGATSTTYTAGSDTVTAVFSKSAFSSIASLSTWLDGQGTNEPITAYNIKLNVDSFGGNASISGSLGYVLIRNNTKYVNLDLSSSTMTEIPELAFFDDVDNEGCNTLVGITIPNSVTSIGEAAFANCIRLTNVTFTPTGRVTSIGNEAFAECISLASITIPASVESIGDMAFYGCTKLADITFTPTSKVTSIGDSAFANCTNLDSITIPTSVNSIGNDAFTDCSSLAAITVDTGNTAYSSQGGILYNNDKTAIVLVPIKITGAITIPNSVESIEFGAFSSRAGLTSVTIGNGVDNIGNGAFSYCTSLADITFTPTSKVTSIGDSAFANCTNLDSITIPDSVTSIGSRVFQNCTNLTSVTFVPTSKVNSIGYEAFWGCTKLTSITIPDSVTSIGTSPFYNCTNLLSISVAVGNTAFSSLDGVLYNIDKTTLVIYPIGKTDTSFPIPNSVTSIGNNAFYQCTNLESVTIGNSVTSIGNSAFASCSKLESVTFTTTSKVTSIGGSAFSGCTSLGSIVIPDSVTSIGSSAFSRCSGLTDITIPFVGGSKTATSASTSTLFGYIFGASSYPGGTYTSQNYATSFSTPYYIPTALRTVTVTAATRLLYGAFSSCANLTSVTIPNSVTSIGSAAFMGCTNLVSVTLPNNTAFTAIGTSTDSDGFFQNCASLASITIPNSVTSIGWGAFNGCTSLASVTFEGTIPSSGFYTNAFSNIGDLRAKYLSGGQGTYTRSVPGSSTSVWTKQ